MLSQIQEGKKETKQLLISYNKKETMSTLKEIGNKLFKEDLSSNKIELSIVDDIQKAYNLANKELSNAQNASKGALAAIDNVFTAYRQNAIAAKQVVDLYTTIEAQAKDLGLPIPANVLKFKTDSVQYMKDSQAKMASLQNAKKLF